MDFLAADKLPFVYRRVDFIAFGLVASMMMVLNLALFCSGNPAIHFRNNEGAG